MLWMPKEDSVKIVFVVASAEGAMCGVGDYTGRLAAAFRAAGADVHVEFLDRWSFAALMRLRRIHGRGRNTIVHLQYPSLTMGNSVAPAFLPLVFGTVFVTLHEFRIFSRIRKYLLWSHSRLDKGLIFSNREERAVFEGYFPHAAGRLSVLPLGMNIPRLPAPQGARPERLIYFGQISINKGIELFIETVEKLRAQDNRIEAAMIGALVDTDPSFVDYVRQSAQRLQIELILNLPAAAVSDALNRSTLALLPFPDGISNKRSSALSCLDHGVTVLTTHSDLTADWLAQTTYPVTTVDDAVASIDAIIAGRLPRQPDAGVLARELKARDWTEIVQAHLALYAKALGKPA